MRQYIGARYVPKLFNYGGSSEWRNNTYYEALTIVTFNNTSYISAIPVPTNISQPPLNPKYWIETGSYNGYIENLENNMLNVSNFVNELPTLKNRYFGILGDSWGVGTTPDGNVTPWSTLLSNLIIQLGGRAAIKCLGGAAFSATNSYLACYNALPNKNELTDIFIAGGTNESGTVDETSSAINSFCSQVRINTPNIRLWYLNVGRWENDVSTSVNRLGRYKAYSKTLISNGFMVEDNGNYIMTKHSFFSSDHNHPLFPGQQAIASYALEFIINGNFDVYYRTNTYTINNAELNIIIPNDVSLKIEPVSTFASVVIPNTLYECVQGMGYSVEMLLVYTTDTSQSTNARYYPFSFTYNTNGVILLMYNIGDNIGINRFLPLGSQRITQRYDIFNVSGEV